MQKILLKEQYDRVLKVLWEGAAIETLQTAEELHLYAWNYNWDSGIDSMRRVIHHPLCDKGTALLIYWYAGPGYLYQFLTRDEVSEYIRDQYDFLMELEQKYLSGAYQSEAITFDPAHDEGTGTNWTKEYAKIPKKRQIPAEMYQPTKGQQFQRKLTIDLYELAEQVTDRASFMSFVKLLMDDWKQHPDQWENTDLEMFFVAALAWSEGHLTADATWRGFAEFLHAGKFYE